MDGQLSDFPANDSIIKQDQFARCSMHICLVDSSKFNQVRPNKLFNISQVEKIITDNGCSLENREEFEKAGIKLIIA